MSDQRPVVFLKSVYQRLNYVINEWLNKIVEPANILQPGQGGSRQGRCISINMQKVHLIQQEARRQGKRVYRVDFDLKDTFNAMSQAALWQMMKMFTIQMLLGERARVFIESTLTLKTPSTPFLKQHSGT